MSAIKLNSHIGPDGILTLTLPAELWNKDVEVMVKPLTANALSPEDRGWPPDFFEKTAGSIPDFPEIEPEGDFDPRDELA